MIKLTRKEVNKAIMALARSKGYAGNGIDTRITYVFEGNDIDSVEVRNQRELQGEKKQDRPKLRPIDGNVFSFRDAKDRDALLRLRSEK